MPNVNAEGTLEKETGKAILVAITSVEGEPCGGDPVWLPKSQVEYDPEDAEPGDDVELDIPEWLAIEKDLV